MLNLIVKKRRKNSQTSELENMRSRAGKIVEHSSSKAKEKLCSIQANVGMPPPPTNTYAMLHRLYEQREPLGAALASLSTDIVPFTADDYAAITQCLTV